MPRAFLMDSKSDLMPSRVEAMDSHELSDIAAAAVTADTIAKVAFTLPAGVLLIVVF
jgi:hypothetical protein